MEFITAYSKKNKYVVGNNSPSMTQQHFKSDCDINTIVRRMTRGLYSPQQTIPGIYTDISETGDYRSALNTFQEASRDFGNLPSAVRRRFANNPVEFLDFLQDPANYPEALSLGLVTRREPAPTYAPVQAAQPHTQPETPGPITTT